MTKNSLLKKSMRIKGHRTSLALEQEFWDGLDRYVKANPDATIPKVIARIDETRDKEGTSLASATRVFLYNIAVRSLGRNQ